MALGGVPDVCEKSSQAIKITRILIRDDGDSSRPLYTALFLGGGPVRFPMKRAKGAWSSWNLTMEGPSWKS